MVRYVVSVEGANGRRYALGDRDSVCLGRADDNAIAFPGERVVSRNHARLAMDGFQLQLESHGRNGTLVNGAFIRNGVPHTLRQGDVIELGPGGPQLKVTEATAAAQQATATSPWMYWTAAAVGTVAAVVIATFVIWNQQEQQLQQRVESAEERIERQTELASRLSDRLSGLERASERLSRRFDEEISHIASSYEEGGEGSAADVGFPSHVLQSVYLVGAANTANSITSIGTCFSIRQSGTLVTNYHVVEGAARVYVERDNEYFPARIVTEDPRLDVAVLRVRFRTEPLVPRNLGRDEVGIGVFAVGFPWADQTRGSATVTRGVVSGVTGDGDRLITDAAINPGNSGGPLVDAEGRVLGMNTSVMRNADVDGAAFAVTIDAILGRL